MIYYFSGTGNSRFVADALSRSTRLPAVDMRTLRKKGGMDFRRIDKSEVLGLIFPVYGWTFPNLCRTFLQELPILSSSDNCYVFVVLTCGDDVGRTDIELRALLARRGYTIAAIWSIAMPNTYIGLPFFDVDRQTVVTKKISKATIKLKEIAASVCARSAGVVDVLPGAFSRLKSGLFRRFFYRFWVGPQLFFTNGHCTGCRRCERVCPLDNVRLRHAEREPEWGRRCTFCLACYHVCPVDNICVRPFGRGKGRHDIFLHQYLKT